MGDNFQPSDPGQVLELLAWAAAETKALEIRGLGSKAGYGRPLPELARLDLAALTGVTLYEPEELVLSAGAGTPLAEIEELLAAENQQLAFEPPSYAALLGASDSAAATIGGVLACNLSGPRRIARGAARDHFLGVKGVSGRGEAFKSGGRVVKNVTGYDMSKLLAGSFGTLAAMTEVTLKVLPAPERTRTVLIAGLADGAAVEALTQAAGSSHDVSGLAHLPATAAARSAVSYVAGAGAAVTALRLEGPGPSVEHRCLALRDEFSAHGPVEELHSTNSATLWREIGEVALLPGGDSVLWRLSTAPGDGARAVDRILGATGQNAAEVFYDWGGGLVWLELPAGEPAAEAVRAALAEDGSATLMRAPAELRARLGVFMPQPPALAALTERLKEAFDPRGILNPGRLYEGV
ncbi:MAG: FAD-binding protein [Alphaproteobacteria bacterium]|jgi:glycolate oxidase FAD binding subunit|nr:FAD-binding protein [Alphaproteobacteria bacterium]MDP6621646.1 FAD-binding protein [Alphaproteobacteria bacterium]